MQRKTMLAACITMAISGQTWAADVSVTDTDENHKNKSKITCPADTRLLSPEALSRLPAECRRSDDNAFIPWLAVGATALTTAIAAHALDDDSDHHRDHIAPPTPPDDGDDVLPPTPPDEGDDDVPPAPPAVVEFANKVTWDQAQSTLKIRDVTFTYSQNADGTITLTAPDGRTTRVERWEVNKADNTLELDGMNGNDTIDWRYDDNGELYIIKKTGIVVDDPTNTAVIKVNDATITDQGGNTALNGATVIDITGNNITLNNDGDIISRGEGSIVGLFTGDDITINNNGSTTADGGTGAIINGDRATINNQGDTTITNGGTGTYITGDFASVNNAGDISVDGAGSTAVVIDGNHSTLAQNGDLLVTNGAMGIIAYGESNALANTGHTTVRDQDSIGFVVAGTQNSFSNKGDIDVSLNGTGALISGDKSQVNLDGDIIVNSEQDSSGVFRGATGVSVTGNGTSTNILGNVTLDSDFASDSKAAGSDTLTGINISGDNNQVNLSGTLSINAVDQSNLDGQYLNSIGLNVNGDSNSVYLMGGLDINLFDAPGMDTSSIFGIRINGASDVTLGGHSQVNITDTFGGNAILVDVQNAGSLVLNDTSTIDVKSTVIDSGYVAQNSLLMATGEDSSIENHGTINSDGMLSFISASKGAQVKNSGDITAVGVDSYGYNAAIEAANEGSEAKNVAGGTITLTTNANPFNDVGLSYFPQMWANNTAYGMLAYDYGSVTNSVGASITLYGAGLYGIGVTKGTAFNAGDIYVDGFKQQLDEDGNIIGESYWRPSNLKLSSAGMIAGSSDYGHGDATVVNTGTITVHNAGYGMTAMSGGMAINQGTINLTADGDTGATNQLVGMAAFDNGIVFNDTNGTINIDADYGQAFYSDGTGFIINNGSINLNGSPMAEGDTHMGTTPTDRAWLPALAGSGETINQTSDTGFFSSEALANYGSATLNGDVSANSWIYNEANARLTVEGELAILSGGLENQGQLTADTITTKSDVYNRDNGSITTDLLTINGSKSFFNDGDFTGSIAGTSYTQNVVNTGDMTVAADGKSLVSGSFKFYNEEGATLANSGNAIEGGENTIINMTRANDSLAQVNSGTINATNGYSAITTAHGSNNPVWIWNTETGVINGINPDAPLINLGRGYNFANQGTINIQGDNAIAISGGATSYTENLVNSGTINVGTEQGQTDGTNGTGLIGIKGNGKATTINNTADGVINVYADNSYAFGGQSQAIINNGEINLLCESGCDIYAPDTTGAHNDGTADIAIPAASTAPAQGSVPTPPADPNAPQTLTNYIVGTNADGSTGTLKANNLVIGDDVKVNTGFTAGTADTTVVVDNAFTGSNIQGAGNITSTSVVWNAQGNTDASGNVDVTMTKNAYADVATDGSVNDMAQALDAGYTNNELYSSLNVSTTAELNSALKQISGSQANTVFREARVLSNRFSMLADSATQVKDGLAFNVVAKGDPRAELGNDTQYDMLALRQTLDLSENQHVQMEYGIARLNGSGSQSAGDNGVTGGYSQFFGLKHQMAFDNGMSWNNALRYDVHNLDSSRSVSYGDVNKTADTSAKQQYLELRSTGEKTIGLNDGLTLTPYAGVKVRHTLEEGYQERNAGDFNLNMNSGSETAVDSIAGLKLNYAGDNGWSVSAVLEGGPNLSYAKSQRSASLAGAGSQQFTVDDGQRGGGINSLATLGVKYTEKDSSLNLETYQWKEDGLSDKGFMLSVKKTF